MEGIPHHMLSIVDITDTSFDVRAYCDMTKVRNILYQLFLRMFDQGIIEDIAKRGKIPIVVGGTHYYVFSLLWNTLIGEEER